MKKVVGFLMVALLVIGFSGCFGNVENYEEDKGNISKSLNLIEIYYLSDYEESYIHYNLNDTEWTNEPGKIMSRSSDFDCIKFFINRNIDAEGYRIYRSENEELNTFKEVGDTKNIIEIHYNTGWLDSYIHYNIDGQNWTDLPGVLMEESDLIEGYKKVVLNMSTLEFVMSDGNNNWDNAPDGGNYYVNESGAYKLDDGIIEKINVPNFKFIDNSALEDKEYYYMVKSYNSTNESDYSNIISGRLLGDNSINLILDTSNLELGGNENEEFYFLSSEMNSISGTIEGINGVKKIDYSLTDSNENILLEGSIEKNEEWSIENFGFGIGYNLLTITLERIDGKKIVYNYAIVNSEEKNITNLNISLDLDTDGDGLVDYYEKHLGLNINSVDTDGDGLNDNIELFLQNVDPLIADTDGNGILDKDEDSDLDGLTNIEELNLKTSLSNDDTDRDGLLDGEEVNIYGTNPLLIDTDGDSLSDYYELENGYNPLVAETSLEKTVSALEYEGQLTKPSVTINGLKPEQVKSLSIRKVNSGLLANPEIPGYIDGAYDFYVDGEFESAEMTFEFDESLFNDPEFVPAIYYFNEELQLLEKLPNQVINGNKISTTVHHFSKYILLNSEKQDAVWEYKIKYEEEIESFSRLDIVFVIDSSGSMGSNDPSDIRINVTRNFINKLNENDRGAIVDFDSGADVLSGFTSNKGSLSMAAGNIDSSGGTNLGAGISTAINLFANENYEEEKALKCIIMLTDGEGSYSSYLTSSAANQDIIIYTVGLGSSVDSGLLRSIANGTGGSYHSASNANALYSVFDAIAEESDFGKDSDDDGIVDYFEKEMAAGNLRLGTGATVKQEESLVGIDYNKFTGKLFFKFYDHFGLDDDDYQYLPIFAEWFALQHYNKFNGKYSPFIIRVEFEEEISGTYKKKVVE